MERSKMSNCCSLSLEGSLGHTNSLICVKTSGRRRSMIQEIRNVLGQWLSNNHFNDVRNAKLDVAIVAFVSKTNMARQDVDNIAKIILDAISRSKHHEGPYLIENDSQVERLLVYKKQKKFIEDHETDDFIISFRVHDSNKQMILEERTWI